MHRLLPILLCLAFLAQLKDIDGVHGVHLMAPGNVGALPSVIGAFAQG